MFYFQILIFIVGITLVSMSISGFGKLINLSIKKNFFLNIFLGFILVTFTITIIHFFFEINIYISILIFISGISIFFHKRKISPLKFIKLENIYYFVIIFLLIPIFLSQKYHEDFGYYHLP